MYCLMMEITVHIHVRCNGDGSFWRRVYVYTHYWETVLFVVSVAMAMVGARDMCILCW